MFSCFLNCSPACRAGLTLVYIYIKMFASLLCCHLGSRSESYLTRTRHLSTLLPNSVFP